MDASPLDKACSLRASINAEVRREHSIVTNPRRRGGLAFFFSYADGVPIDLGQEERLLVKDIATSPAFSARDINSGDYTPWGEGEQPREACVFLRLSSSNGGPARHRTGNCGALHRWEDLPGRSHEIEVHSCCRLQSSVRKRSTDNEKGKKNLKRRRDTEKIYILDSCMRNTGPSTVRKRVDGPWRTVLSSCMTHSS